MDAFNNVKDGETIKLRTDFDVYGCGLNKKANVTLDLNGHNLKISPWGNISVEKGSLTVIGKGSIKKNGKSGSMFFVWKSGTLNLNADADYLGAINIDGS